MPQYPTYFGFSFKKQNTKLKVGGISICPWYLEGWGPDTHTGNVLLVGIKILRREKSFGALRSGNMKGIYYTNSTHGILVKLSKEKYILKYKNFELFVISSPIKM